MRICRGFSAHLPAIPGHGLVRVYVYPADVFGCGHYRLIWPAEALRQNHGVDVITVPPGDITGIGIRRDAVTGAHRAMYPKDADVIVFQRPSHPQLVDVISLLRDEGVAVVVDVDDDLRHIHPANPAWAHLHPKSNTDHTWGEVSRACREATLVTVSTPQLEKVYGAHGRVNTLYNYIPAEFLDTRHTNESWVGWAGSTHSHPDDLRVLGTAVQELLDERIPFRVVGTSAGAGKQLGLMVDPSETGAVEFYDWPAEVAKIGVGVAPLTDTVFNSSKSWLKPLEYSAMGVPWVASPRTEYKRLHSYDCGVLAETPRDWARELKRLAKDEHLRSDESVRARLAATRLTIEEHAWRWAEAWERAVGLRNAPRSRTNMLSTPMRRGRVKGRR